MGDRLKVVFLPNFRVSLAEEIYPGSDLSEQISTAGTEASGTGNMKFAMNGALTIGTLDGANVEIMEEVGEENIFIFGLRTPEVLELKKHGYNPEDYLHKSEELKRVFTLIHENFFSKDQIDLFKPIHDSLLYQDVYCILPDFPLYADCQRKVSEEYKNKSLWTKKSILNVARIGKFSSDRTIQQYAEEIWKIKKVEIKHPDFKFYMR
jgi:starch phosphorylase